MNIGVVGQFTAKDISVLTGNFVRFAIAIDDKHLPKSFNADTYLNLKINGQEIKLGLTGIYEIDHPIYIEQIEFPRRSSQTDPWQGVQFYLDYVIQGEE